MGIFHFEQQRSGVLRKMKEQLHEGLLGRLVNRLGNWTVVGISLAISNVLLVVFLILHQSAEKTILTPAIQTKEYWVQGDAASPEYYEQMATTFTELMLNYNPENAIGRFEEVLKHVNPGASNELRRKLMADLDDIKTKQRSSVFYPIELRVKGKTVLLFGQKVDMVTGNVIGQNNRGYRITFDYHNGRLFVAGFQEMPELANGITTYENAERVKAGNPDNAQGTGASK